MPQLNIGQQGTIKSTPKLTRINGDDNSKVIYRNLGNNHAYPFVWANTATVASGTTTVTLASGIKWHGYELAANASVIATPKGDIGTFYTTASVGTNVITLTCENAPSADTEVAVMYMLGGEMVVEGLACRGNTGATQSLP